jgi:hypothetical protein
MLASEQRLGSNFVFGLADFPCRREVCQPYSESAKDQSRRTTRLLRERRIPAHNHPKLVLDSLSGADLPNPPNRRLSHPLLGHDDPIVIPRLLNHLYQNFPGMPSVDERKNDLLEQSDFEGEASTEVVGELGGGGGETKGCFGTLVGAREDGGDE